MSRPFVSYSIDQLEARAKENGGNQTVLALVLAELKQRSSARARRLAARLAVVVSGTGHPKSVVPSLPHKPIERTSISIAAVSPFGRQPASELLRDRLELEGTLLRLVCEVREADATFRAECARRDVLNMELARYVAEVVPGFDLDRSDEPTTSRYELARRSEIDRLRASALRRWPSREALERHTNAATLARKQLDQIRAQQIETQAKLAKMDDFIKRNASAIANDLENDLVRHVAAQICAGTDDFELLKQIRAKGHTDAVGFLTRARIYSINVLGKVGKP